MSTAPFLWLCSESNPNQFKGILPVQVNTAAAKAAGLEHGDLCVVRSAQGELVCQAACSDTQRSDLVCVPRGGWELAGRNVNLLTSAVVSKVGNGAAYYETTVTLHPHSPAQGGAANRRCGDDD
jgi:anaerobic selenocysteine-containing dehydrogenase